MAYKLLKIYVNESEKSGHNSLYHVLLKEFKEMGLAGVTVIRGLEGYGHSKNVHNAKVLDISLSLPVILEIVDTEENIERALPAVKRLVTKGLVTVSDVDVIC